MNPFIQIFSDIPQIKGIADSISNKHTPVGLTGTGDSLCPLISYITASLISKKPVIITHSRTSAYSIYQNLLSIYKKDVVYLPVRELMLFDIDAYQDKDRELRLNALYKIANNDFSAVVACTEALSVGTTRADIFLDSIIRLEQGGIYDTDELSDKLIRLGYSRRALVEDYGQFSIRGGILDIFSVNYDNPVRCDFFGDAIDSIKFFDSDTQRSIDTISKVEIIPFTEFLMSKQQHGVLSDYITDAYDKDLFNNNELSRVMDRYFAASSDCQMTAKYFNKNAMIIVHNDVRCHKTSDTVFKEYANMCEGLLSKKKTVPQACSMQNDIFSLYSTLKPDMVFVYEKTGYNIRLFHEFDIMFDSVPAYKGNVEQLLHDVTGYKSEGMFVFICSDDKRNTLFLKSFFEENNLIVRIISDEIDSHVSPAVIYIVENGYNESFISKQAKTVCVSVSRIFRKTGRKKAGQIKDDDFFAMIQPDDYVVHDYHGIGIYRGVEKIEIEGIIKDYIKIEYKNNDMLYVPVSKMDLVKRYVGSGERAPRLYGLGGKEWEKQKTKVRSAVRDIAKQLIQLYTARAAQKGHVFGADTPWQISFENEFEYEETDDQIRCTEEIKQDMETSIVMDRLLCGDVGYGKTEVALRVAFKAVMDGKQVAFLAPTTMLALQHYNNFTRRMKNYPINIDMLSRLRDKKKQDKSVEQLNAGSTDIIVGTHRILGKDIKFKNLGLLVVDEEQRFGVAQKESIKMLKPDVDVLTLSATPIPRTMHMALSGIRDVSTIYDPPEKRFPVQTYVMEYAAEFIKEAILREKDRNGQIFYLYNRVSDMDNKMYMLQNMFKDKVRICMAHGQMPKKQFEDTIIKFINKEYDMLLCTTIIEAGTDIPNANTLIIEDADKLGLSQIYQIKGRVGRSDRVAYAYITYKRGKALTEDAQKRLDTIQELTEFGSGIKIAMKDLEIRGAGDLLGAEQSGFLQGVGYEMYVRILGEEIAGAKGEKIKRPFGETLIDMNIDAYIDKAYIQDDLSRLRMYKRISLTDSATEKYDIIDELIDRYSQPPSHVINIIDVAYVKNLASSLGINDIKQTKKGFTINVPLHNTNVLKSMTDALDSQKYRYNVRSYEFASIKVQSTDRGEILLKKITQLLENVINKVKREIS